jgi:hypothetical protein
MTIFPDLESVLGYDIKDICKNRFHDPSANHCAHFVSHAMDFTFSYHCREFQGGSKEPANIRVHEIFAECPRVGNWSDTDTSKSQLIFVTRKDVVDIVAKKMQNIPQKHIGIYHNNAVYHYSNTQDEVVKQSVDDFYERFQATYSGDQGLFFGEFPHSDLMLTVEASAAHVTHPYAFALRKSGNKWHAKRADIAGASEFLVGVEVRQPAKNYYGLHLPGSAYYGPKFKPADYVEIIDHWAYLLDVTAAGESDNRFNLINTYDRARFTFGFYQLAAHTPRDNLILFFREALLDSEFQQLFPDLKLIGGKVFRVAQDGTTTDLEEEFHDPSSGEQQIQRFMTYLNPNRTEIDEQEVLQAARVIWWTNESESAREIQVKVSNSILQRKMSQRYNAWYDLDGRSDTICAIVADIHHQGRGTKTQVRSALASSNPVKSLLPIGKANYPERVATLTARVKYWTDRGLLGSKKYRASLNQFE